MKKLMRFILSLVIVLMANALPGSALAADRRGGGGGGGGGSGWHGVAPGDPGRAARRRGRHGLDL